MLLGPRTSDSSRLDHHLHVHLLILLLLDLGAVDPPPSPPLAGMSHPSVLDWDTAGARCRGQKARTPAAPQLTRSQSSTKQTPDRLSPESRSWQHAPANVWKCWAVVIGAPPCGTWGGCRQTTAGSQMLMVARLLPLPTKQAWAHQEDIRGGLPSPLSHLELSLLVVERAL